MQIDITEKDRIVEECRSMMSEGGYSEAQISQFCSVASVFFIAYVTGIPLTISLLLMLIIMVVPLSLATPEMIPAVTIILNTFGIRHKYSSYIVGILMMITP